MKRLTLSDHTHEQAERFRRDRLEAYAQGMEQHQAACIRRDARKSAYRAELGDAIRNREVLGTLKCAWNVLFGELPYVPPMPFEEPASREEEIWKAGNEGEQRVAEHLSSRLSDEWILVSGFMTGRGEIDLILVGPAGVFALEVKNVRGVVHCDGDRWWRDKYDNYGNLVESNVPLHDAGGRAPSRQLNETADILEQLLDRRFGRGRVRRVVVLAHDHAGLGDIENATVDAVVCLAGWEMDEVPGPAREIPRDVVEEVAREMERRHLVDRPHRSARCAESRSLRGSAG